MERILVLLLAVELALPLASSMDPAAAAGERAAAAANANVPGPRVRLRRKIGQVNATNTAVAYMQELLSNITTSEGKPKYGEYDPTDAWCFTDRGEQ